MELTPALLRETYVQHYDYGSDPTLGNLQSDLKNAVGKIFPIRLIVAVARRLASLNSDVRLQANDGGMQQYWRLVIGRRGRY